MYPSNDHLFKDKTHREILGQKLAYARLTKGLTQMNAMELSGLLVMDDGKTRGVSKGFLTYVEAGRRGITKDQLQLLAACYNVPIKHFMDAKPLQPVELAALSRLQRVTRAVSGHGGRRVRKKSMNAENVATRRVAAVVTSTKTRTKRVAQTPGPLTQADYQLLELTTNYTEPQKLWCVNALKAVLDKVTTKAKNPQPVKESKLARKGRQLAMAGK